MAGKGTRHHVRVNYKPLWILLIKRDIPKQKLREMTDIAPSTFTKMVNNEHVALDVLARISPALGCGLTNMDQFMAGNLEEQVYQKRRAEFTKEAECLDGLISDLEAKLQEMEAVRDDGTKAALETMEQFAGATELDQKMVDALIEKVLVYDLRHVEIRWKFTDEVMKLLGV